MRVKSQTNPPGARSEERASRLELLKAHPERPRHEGKVPNTNFWEKSWEPRHEGEVPNRVKRWDLRHEGKVPNFGLFFIIRQFSFLLRKKTREFGTSASWRRSQVFTLFGTSPSWRGSQLFSQKFGFGTLPSWRCLSGRGLTQLQATGVLPEDAPTPSFL